jgi:hypothetical protein
MPRRLINAYRGFLPKASPTTTEMSSVERTLRRTSQNQDTAHASGVRAADIGSVAAEEPLVTR